MPLFPLLIDCHSTHLLFGFDCSEFPLQTSFLRFLISLIVSVSKSNSGILPFLGLPFFLLPTLISHSRHPLSSVLILTV
jgi:hypothetical protein